MSTKKTEKTKNSRKKSFPKFGKIFFNEKIVEKKIGKIFFFEKKIVEKKLGKKNFSKKNLSKFCEKKNFEKNLSEIWGKIFFRKKFQCIND